MIPIRSPRTRSGAATSDAKARSGARRPGIAGDVVDDLRVALEDRAEDPDAGLHRWAAELPSRGRTSRPVPTAAQQADEPLPAGRQPARLGHRDPGDRVGLERRPDLVRQVVDQVELAVPVERLAGERALVGLAGAGVREHGRDAAARSRAGDPADRVAVDQDRVPLFRGVRGGVAGLPVEDDLAVEIGDRDPRVGATPGGPTASARRGGGGRPGDEGRRPSISRPRRRSPSTSRARRSSSSGSNGLVMYRSAPAARPCSRS